MRLCASVVERDQPPRIYVLAGVNGAGKSSIEGATLNERGAEYFNPDVAARQIRQADPRLALKEANSLAWHQGGRLLERAIAERQSFALETTLGGNTITGLLERASEQGLEVRVWYAGLSSPELHIARVRQRVLGGGHDIPESDIRRRYENQQAQPDSPSAEAHRTPRLRQQRRCRSRAGETAAGQADPPHGDGEDRRPERPRANARMGQAHHGRRPTVGKATRVTLEARAPTQRHPEQARNRQIRPSSDSPSR